MTQRFLLMSLILSLLAWTGLARQLRGKVMGYAKSDYVSAAKSAGAKAPRIITTHLLPNSASHIVAVAMLAIPAAIIAETTLSFLGIGMTEPAISWGVLLKDASAHRRAPAVPLGASPGRLRDRRHHLLPAPG